MIGVFLVGSGMLMLGFILGFLLCSPAHAHGAPNWDPDTFGDNDGIIEVHRENVGFKGILKEEIRQYNRMRGQFFVDENIIRQVPTSEKAEVIIRSTPSPDFACGGSALVYVGFEAKDYVTIADGCFDYLPENTQPIRGTILHEVMGHLNGIHHHDLCTPEWQAQTVMVAGPLVINEKGELVNQGCEVTLQNLGPHDVETLAGPG
jgi:hypothetical protein